MKLFTSSILLTLCIQYVNANMSADHAFACSANDTEWLYQSFVNSFGEPNLAYNLTESCDSCIGAPYEEDVLVDYYPGSCFPLSVYEENESCPANVTGTFLFGEDGLSNDDTFYSSLPMDCQTCLIPGLILNLFYFGYLASEDPPLFNQTRISSTAPCTAQPEPASCTIADVEAVGVCDEESDEFTFGTCLFGSASSITAECQTCLVSVFWYSNLRPEVDGEELFSSSCVGDEAWPSDIGPPSSAPTMAPSMVPAPSPKSPTTKAPSSPTSAGANLIAGGIVTTVAAFFALAT